MALRAAVERFEQVRDPLMMVMQVAAEDPWILSAEEVWRLNYGFFVFAATRHRPALKPLLDFLSWAESDAFEIVGDFIRDDAAEVIAALACGDGATVADATLRRSLDWAALDAMHRAMGIMALRGDWPRAAYLEHMTRTLAERLLDHSAQPLVAWSSFAEVAACTHLWELAPELAKLYRSGRVDAEWITEAELAAILKSPGSAHHFLRRHPEIVDPAERVARWEDPWNVVSEGTTARKLLRIGRNDPCHCGSGVKFKRCCGRVEEGWL